MNRLALSEQTRTVLSRLREGLSALYGPRLRGVYLFGSYARGEQGAESDLDVLIVLDTVTDYSDEVERTGHLVADLSLEYGVSISRVFVPEGDWLHRQTRFLSNVRREAIPA